MDFGLENYVGGSEIIADTNEHTGRWWKIVVAEADTTFAALAGSNFTAPGSGETFPANFEFIGNFTTIDLGAGKVLAYKV